MSSTASTKTTFETITTTVTEEMESLKSTTSTLLEPITHEAENRAKFPELAAEDKNINRHVCKRVVPLKVLVLGMMGTGNASLRKALQILGYNDTYYMYSTWENPRDCDVWNQALNAKFFKGKPFPVDYWDRLLGHCEAVTDMPAAAFAPELIAAYPDAKVVLPLWPGGDVFTWHAAVEAHITKNRRHPLMAVLAVMDTDFMAKWIPMREKLMNGLFRNNFDSIGRQIFNDHYDEVRRLVPKDRLLEFTVGEDGWEKLCPFLGNKIPDREFPVINEAEIYEDRHALMRRTRLWFVFKPFLTWAVVLAFMAWAFGDRFYQFVMKEMPSS